MKERPILFKAHEIAPTYSTYNADKRVLWHYRQSVLRTMGLPMDADWSRGVGGPLRVLIVQKPDKRVIMNIAEVAGAITAAATAAGLTVEVTALDWKDAGGFAGEVTTLLRTHIVVSMDGSGVAATATGSTLGGALVDLGWPGLAQGGSFTILQGQDMGAPSRLEVTVSGTPGASVRVSGAVRPL